MLPKRKWETSIKWFSSPVRHKKTKKNNDEFLLLIYRYREAEQMACIAKEMEENDQLYVVEPSDTTLKAFQLFATAPNPDNHLQYIVRSYFFVVFLLAMHFQPHFLPYNWRFSSSSSFISSKRNAHWSLRSLIKFWIHLIPYVSLKDVNSIFRYFCHWLDLPAKQKCKYENSSAHKEFAIVVHPFWFHIND